MLPEVWVTTTRMVPVCVRKESLTKLKDTAAELCEPRSDEDAGSTGEVGSPDADRRETDQVHPNRMLIVGKRIRSTPEPAWSRRKFATMSAAVTVEGHRRSSQTDQSVQEDDREDQDLPEEVQRKNLCTQTEDGLPPVWHVWGNTVHTVEQSKSSATQPAAARDHLAIGASNKPSPCANM